MNVEKRPIPIGNDLPGESGHALDHGDRPIEIQRKLLTEATWLRKVTVLFRNFRHKLG
jgi:hypothetical protein